MEQVPLDLQADNEFELIAKLQQMIDHRIAHALRDAVVMRDNDSLSDYMEAKVAEMLDQHGSKLQNIVHNLIDARLDDRFDVQLLDKIRDAINHEIEFTVTAR